jgi:hypothetical protein
MNDEESKAEIKPMPSRKPPIRHEIPKKLYKDKYADAIA